MAGFGRRWGLRTPAVQPNGENATLEELRVAMEAAPNQRSYIRLNVIRSQLLGVARPTLCAQICRTDRMVRLWIELFNRGGIDALITKARPGRKRKVKLERVRDLLVPVLENPATGPSERCRFSLLTQLFVIHQVRCVRPAAHPQQYRNPAIAHCRLRSQPHRHSHLHPVPLRCRVQLPLQFRLRPSSRGTFPLVGPPRA